MSMSLILPVCAWKALVDPTSGSTYYAHNTGATTWTRPAEMDAYDQAVAAQAAAAAAAAAATVTPSIAIAVAAEPVAAPAMQPNTPSKRPPPPLPSASSAAMATPPISTRALGDGSNDGAAVVDAAASLDAPDTSVPSVIDVPGTSWSQVLDVASGKFYYANKSETHYLANVCTERGQWCSE